LLGLLLVFLVVEVEVDDLVGNLKDELADQEERLCFILEISSCLVPEGHCEVRIILRVQQAADQLFEGVGPQLKRKGQV